MTRQICRSTLALAALVIISSAIPVTAGDVNLSWDPSPGAAGYRVHRGTTPGNYPTSDDVMNTTTTTVQGLQDCVTSYFAVTAYNTAGESGYSVEVASFPRAALFTASPPNVEQGGQTSITISGLNFRPGDTVSVSNPGVQIDSLSVNACNQLVVDVTVGDAAATGAADVTVTHPSGVAGTGVGLLTIEESASAAVPPPPTGVVVN